MRYVRFVCRECGSADLSWDACSNWCEATQSHFLAATADTVFCAPCDTTVDTDIIELPEWTPPPVSEWQRHVAAGTTRESYESWCISAYSAPYVQVVEQP